MTTSTPAFYTRVIKLHSQLLKTTPLKKFSQINLSSRHRLYMHQTDRKLREPARA